MIIDFTRMERGPEEWAAAETLAGMKARVHGLALPLASPDAPLHPGATPTEEHPAVYALMVPGDDLPHPSSAKDHASVNPPSPSRGFKVSLTVISAGIGGNPDPPGSCAIINVG
jgi:hypothetical protein